MSPKSIADLREQARLSERDVANALALDAATYARLERGAIAPSVTQLRQLAGLLGVSPEQLPVVSTYRLVDIQGHCFMLAARRVGPRSSYEAKPVEYNFANARSNPQRAIPGIDPPSNSPSLIVTTPWTATGDNADEALSALEQRIQDALLQVL